VNVASPRFGINKGDDRLRIGDDHRLRHIPEQFFGTLPRAYLGGGPYLHSTAKLVATWTRTRSRVPIS
jgi:hypothetical protein